MAAIRTFGWYAMWVAVGMLPAGTSVAGPTTGAPCNIGKFISSTSTFYYDQNGNGVWNGTGAGDSSLVLNAAAGAGTGFLGDWNDDGVDDGGKQVSTAVSIDKNGNKAWNGNSGGDSNTNFATSFGAGTPFGFDAGSPDVIGRYVVGTSTFYIDANGNGVWNGAGGGDISSAFAASFGAGVALIGDWNGDGDDEIGRVVGSSFYLDLNDNNAWNGNASGDRTTTFGASFGAGIPLAGNWDGAGGVEIGKFVNGTYYLDLNGNGVWDGAAGGDLSSNFAGFLGTSGTLPLVCDWDGDGDDDIAKVAGTTFAVDLNGNLSWNGAGGGDRQSNFAIGGTGDPLGGVWSKP